MGRKEDSESWPQVFPHFIARSPALPSRSIRNDFIARDNRGGGRRVGLSCLTLGRGRRRNQVSKPRAGAPLAPAKKETG